VASGSDAGVEEPYTYLSRDVWIAYDGCAAKLAGHATNPDYAAATARSARPHADGMPGI